jgi:uncharacterized membrane protein
MNSPSDSNRYQPPQSDVTPPDQDDELISGGQLVMPGNGVTWISDGWKLFAKSPWIWIATILILFGLSIVLAVIPLIGGLASNLLMPVMIGGIMLGCRSLDNDGTLQIEHLFSGFKEKAGPLIMVGLCMLGATVVILVVIVVAVIVMFGTTIMQSFGDQQAMLAMFGEQGLMMVLLVALVLVALFTPLAMAYWFAPALVVFHNMDAVSAMRHSFTGCLRNFVPFLLYGIVFLLLAVVALIPCGLGYLVLVPVGYASLYCSYKDIYLRH